MTKTFRRDTERCRKRGYDMELLKTAIRLLEAEGKLIREAVNASLDQNVRTPEIQVEGGAKYGTKEVGAWIVNYVENKKIRE